MEQHPLAYSPELNKIRYPMNHTLEDSLRVKNLRSDEHLALRAANRAWNQCIANNFLPRFMKGEDV